MITGATVVDFGDYGSMGEAANGSVIANDTMTLTVILYKGKAYVWTDHAASSVSGSITELGEYHTEFYITGDCTITF